ncbi:hypothetical protein Tco_0675921 [Tanacetum coccineum]
MIIRPDIDEIDIDDLYNNLRVYEDELKSTASGDFEVSTAGGINQVPSTPCAHDVAYSFLAQPTTSPQLENEDFRSRMEMIGRILTLSMVGGYGDCQSVKKVLQRTGKNLVLQENDIYEEFKEDRSYGDNGRSNAPTNESSSQTLVAQDGLGGYDWSNDFEVEPVNYALMAISSSKSTPANDRSSKEDGYHVVTPLITGNFLTPRVDMSFAGKTNDANTKKPKSASESVVSNPKINRYRVIIEDWNSDDEEEVYEVKTVRPETQTVKTRDDKVVKILRNKELVLGK